MVEAVNGLWEWGGRTVSPHPHAHSTSKKHSCTSSTAHYLHDCLPSSWSAHIHAQAYLVSLTQTFALSTTVLKCWRTSNSCPPSVVVHPCARKSGSSSRRDHNLSIILMHRYSSVLGAHTTSWELCVFIHGFPYEGPFAFLVVCMFFLTSSWPVHMFTSAQL